MQIANEFLSETLTWFKFYKRTGEVALGQLETEDFFWEPGLGANSIAVIVKHLHGNMRSRWTNFLGSDGEKPDRDRDAEFEDDDIRSTTSRKQHVLEQWEDGWACLLEAIGQLQADDLMRTVHIRGQALSVISAIQRQMAHVPYHVGQIVYLAKTRRGTRWESPSIARGQSQSFNQQMNQKFGETRE